MNVLNIFFGIIFLYFILILLFRLGLWLLGSFLRQSIDKGIRNKAKTNRYGVYEKEEIIDAEFKEIK